MQSTLTHTLCIGPGLGHRQETPWLCLQEITVEEAKDYSLVEPVPPGDARSLKGAGTVHLGHPHAQFWPYALETATTQNKASSAWPPRPAEPSPGDHIG